MFTFRFMNGGDSTVVSGLRYDKRHLLSEDMTKASACIVTIYQFVTSDNEGVEFHVGSDGPGHPVAYVENSAGKTIDRIGPF